MAEGHHPTIDFFGEDQGHELFCRPLMLSLAAQAGLRVPELHTVSARGGHGRVITELKGWLKARHLRGDLLVVVIDANSVGWHAQRRAVEQVVEQAQYPATVIGCPDPHVEAWVLADLPALTRSLGIPEDARFSDESLEPKKRLTSGLEAAGHLLLGDAMSVALDVVPHMDLYAAGRRNASLADFVEGLRAALRRLTSP